MIRIASEVFTPASEGELPPLGTLHLHALEGGCLQIECRGKTITLDPARLDFTPDIAVGYAGLENDIELVWDSERFNTRDVASRIADRKGVADLTAFLFLVAFDGPDLYLVTRLQVAQVPTGIEHTAINAEAVEHRRPRLWLAEQSPALLSLVVRNKAKRNLLAHIKPEDSLAALENQIDFLSEIILAMLAAQPLETPAAWLKPFAALMVAHSSVQFKDAQISVADPHRRHADGLVYRNRGAGDPAWWRQHLVQPRCGERAGSRRSGTDCRG